MTTAEDILKKSKTKKQSTFQPVQRRAWDYLEETAIDDKSNSEQLTNETKKDINTVSNIVENVIEKLSAETKDFKVEIENTTKLEINELKESFDTPTKEATQKNCLP